MSVAPRGMSIQEAYREFRDGHFIVNRRYQRKLVWTIEEKQKLIDSILHGYPLPLFLFATSIRENDERIFEIIDGMQRLNAIFDFIENKYPVLGDYFDVDQHARARQNAEAGIFQRVGNECLLLDASKCSDILDYQLAITEFPGQDNESVNQVFGRINSYGRQLSDQERRQAGVDTVFASTVRELSAQIRGDVSTELLNLADMPQISIESFGDGQHYGIIADDTFWCKQGILRRSQLRESEDEQFVADILISILEEQPFAFSGSNLNEYYSVGTNESDNINTKLISYGVERIKSEVTAVFSIIKNVIEDIDQNPNALGRIVHPTRGTNPIKTAFYAVYMAFFKLCVIERKAPIDSAGIMNVLQNLQSRLNVSAGAIRSEPRQQNVRLTIGLIQNYFEEIDPPAITHGGGTVLRFENAIRRSKVETAAYECKQGILTLGATRNEQDGIIEKIIQTICGIANIGKARPGEQFAGALFIGVADTIADKNRIEMLDGIQAKQIGSRYCVGIEREAMLLNVSIDTYKQKIVSSISTSALSQNLKTAVLSNIDCILYRQHSVICIWIPFQASVSHINDEVFIRQGSNTIQVAGFAQMQSVIALFQ